MKAPWKICSSSLILAAIGLGLALPASAQYIWLNEKGVKQYSDMPPPSSVPANKILKSPAGSAAKPVSGELAPTGTANAAGHQSAPKPDAQKTLAEQNADFQKRRIEQAEKEKQAEEAAKAKNEKAKNCERARGYQRALDEGHRVSRADKNGERAFLTDEERAQESKETRRILDQCK